MKLLDANILLYAHDRSSSHHTVCHEWLEATLNADEIVALPWQTILAFVRIATNPKATRRPLTGPVACAIVDSWLSCPSVAVVGPGERFWDIFRAHVGEARISGPLVTDTALAALAFENGAVLCSTDRDFRRFKDLRVLDPIS
ncbi:MAG TPA: TA system VapC family ribonuclease toxin [Steroidobacteraceae bacterium]|nr:TA system VapC family ribonuclease toxin [Steroidobacteraceae bacterium]